MKQKRMEKRHTLAKAQPHSREGRRPTRDFERMNIAIYCMRHQDLVGMICNF